MSSSVAMVTGGATGIGAASSRLLARHGLRVAICDINGDAGEALAREIDGVYLPCDVADFDSMARAVQNALVVLASPDTRT